MKGFRESGVTDELVLVVPYILYMRYFNSTWEQVKKEIGVDHVERSEIGFPTIVEAMIVQRSEYLRMYFKSLRENPYNAKLKELYDAITKCEQAEKEFKSRTCKFRSQMNCDFCSFHSDCEEHWKEGDAE